MVLVMVLFCGFAKVVDPRCDFVDMSDSVQFFWGEVVEGMWEFFIGRHKLCGVEAFVNSGQSLHNHAEPSWAVEDRVWCVERGGKRLAETIYGIEGSPRVNRVQDCFQGKWCSDLDG